MFKKLGKKKILILLSGCFLLLLSFSPLFILYRKATHVPSSEELIEGFQENKSEFIQIRDMILDEEELMSIGDDNVGDFWLFHGKWTTNEPPYEYFSTQEMLEAVGLSEKRYEEYLSLLGKIGAYRVSKQDTQQPDKIISIGIYRSGIVPSGRTIDIIYSPDELDANFSTCKPQNSSGTCYYEIEYNWYIEEDWD